MIKQQLSISTAYVPEWGLHEAIRELLQNALDQVRSNPESKLILEYDSSRKTLRVGATNCQLARKTLLLGVSDKRGDASLIGNEGEGYKLAMLVLCRSFYDVQVRTADELWSASIVRNNELDCEVLEVKITDEISLPGLIDPTNDVVFTVVGIDEKDYQSVIRKIYLPDAIDDTVVPDRPGEIFVGGLRVCHVPECKDGYNFRPGVLKLNRDRNLIGGFDLFWATSKL